MSRPLRRASIVFRQTGLREFCSRLKEYATYRKELFKNSWKSKYIYTWSMYPYIKRTYCQQLRDPPIDPFRIVWVDPSHIEFISERPFAELNRWADAGAVRGGDWDQETQSFETHRSYKMLKKRIEKGQQWEEIHEIGEIIDCIRNGGSDWNCTTETQVKDRSDQLDKLIRSIEREGYKKRSELVRNGEISKHTDRYFYSGNRFLEETDEVSVDIGRSGQLLFVDGRHRLAIAKLLDLDRIAVRIIVRHTLWQQKRKQFSRPGPDPEFVAVSNNGKHPDVY